MLDRYTVGHKRNADSSCVWTIKDGKAILLNGDGCPISFLSREEAYALADLINTTHDSLIKEIHVLEIKNSKLENELSEAKKELTKLRKSNRTGW